MSSPHVVPNGGPVCHHDARRPRVRASDELAGIDYVEVYEDRLTLCVHFFGTLPKDLGAQHVVIQGGVRIRDIAIVEARFHDHEDGDRCLLMTVDKTGDFSPYHVCLVDPATGGVPRRIDPRYACAPFSFRIDCGATLDCRPEMARRPDGVLTPAINYLARDYESFRRLILDRLAQTMPEWRERHAPDLGITIAELLAYVADQLSYQLDAVAMEAFLRTARRRISVRRHARLVDYWLHEGCNARTWITLDVSADLPTVALTEIKLATIPTNRGGGGTMTWNEMQDTAGAQIFEPVGIGGRKRVDILAAHSHIEFYTWEQDDCWLRAGSTTATLRDGSEPDKNPETPPNNMEPKGGKEGKKYVDDKGGTAPPNTSETPWRLKLKPGDFLIFEQTRGCETGAVADADPSRRHVVRLTGVDKSEDPLTGARVWEIAWHPEDALPFDLCLRIRIGAPECYYESAAIAHGNVLLVDHGRTFEEAGENWVVGSETELHCTCEPKNTEQQTRATPLRLRLGQSPITHAEPMDVGVRSARALTRRDPRQARPVVRLDASRRQRRRRRAVVKPAVDTPPPSTAPRWENTFGWRVAADLLASGRDERRIAIEIDDEGAAHVRFGDGHTGTQPQAGSRFRAKYRIGNGVAGNVGRDSIVWVAFEKSTFSGSFIRPRNPFPATGGMAPETIDSAKRHAPSAYSRVLARAVAGRDYAQLATSDTRVQGAFGALAWTGSWYEASIAVDPLAPYAASEVEASVRDRLESARRIGHDLRVVSVRRVPLDIELAICVKAGHLRGDVERAVKRKLSAAVLPDGSRGLFHPDEWQFGTDVAASPILAAVQGIDGVEHVELAKFRRLYDGDADGERWKTANVIAIAPDEIAVLQGDANFPEQGRLTLRMRGGR